MTTHEVEDLPLGRHEIGKLLDVLPQTVSVWDHRGIFPPADVTTRAQRLWYRSTVEKWARETGRWPYDDEGNLIDESQR